MARHLILFVAAAQLADAVQCVLSFALRAYRIALLPAAYSAARVADGSLVPVLPDHVGAVSTIALVYPDRRFLKPAVRAFVEHVVAHFPRVLRSLDAAGPDGAG